MTLTIETIVPPSTEARNVQQSGDVETYAFIYYLRALSALLIVWNHLALGFWKNNAFIANVAHTQPLRAFQEPCWLATSQYLRNLLHFDWTGVALPMFFLISGFVIPQTIERTGAWAFAIRRTFRVYPTYIFCLAVTCGVAFAYTRSVGQPYPYTWSQFFANASLFRDLLWVPSIDFVGWTLEIEIKFYLLCALLWRTSIFRNPLGLSLLGAALIVLPTVSTLWKPDINSHLLLGVRQAIFMDPSWVILSLIGVAFYNHARGYWRLKSLMTVLTILTLCQLSATVASTTVLNTSSDYPLSLVGIAAFASTYLCRTKIRTGSLIAGLAEISYPLYLLHAVNGFILLTVLYPLIRSSELTSFVAIALILLVSWSVNSFVSRPTNNFGRWLSTKVAVR